MTNSAKPVTKNWLFWLGLALGFLLFLYLIRSILLPFVLGIFTAYFLDPAADKLEKWGLSRGLAVLVITVSFFLGVTLAALLIAPIIINQLSGLLSALPDYLLTFEQRYETRLTQWLGALPGEYIERVKAGVANFSGVMVGMLGNFATGIFQSGMLIVNLLSLMLITPVVAFYLLRDWDKITARLDNLLPRPYAPTIREQLAIIDATIAGFVRGQLNVCLLLGAFYAIGLSLVGLKFGILIGLVTGLLVIFPYVGMILGMGTALAIAFFQFDNSLDIGLVVVVFALGQIIEGYFVTPKLVGEKVGLHPVWIIFGMLAGAALFGFVGVLLAVPITAVIGVLVRFALWHYLQSSYYHGEAPH